jgi:hypothetical protein
MAWRTDLLLLPTAAASLEKPGRSSSAKRASRGEGSSGLTFDRIVDVPRCAA